MDTIKLIAEHGGVDFIEISGSSVYFLLNSGIKLTTVTLPSTLIFRWNVRKPKFVTDFSMLLLALDFSINEVSVLFVQNSWGKIYLHLPPVGKLSSRPSQLPPMHSYALSPRPLFQVRVLS